MGDALPGTLTLHQANLLHEGAFDSVVEGADYVFHVASPFQFPPKEDVERLVIEPAVKCASRRADLYRLYFVVLSPILPLIAAIVTLAEQWLRSYPVPLAPPQRHGQCD